MDETAGPDEDTPDDDSVSPAVSRVLQRVGGRAVLDQLTGLGGSNFTSFIA